MGTNPSAFSTGGSSSGLVIGKDTRAFPVESVTWYDAIEFCNKLSAKDGRLSAYYVLTNVGRKLGSIKLATVTVGGGNGYRLPTEAEWEYACRANTTTPFHFGRLLNGDKANMNGNYPFGTTKGQYLNRPTTVESYNSNAFGLRDMHGNVWEYCFDVYDKSAYRGRRGTTIDPITTTGSEYRVLRSGSWNNSAGDVRSANRGGLPPGYSGRDFGFRVLRGTP